MNYAAPAFGAAPVAVAAKTSTVKIIVIVTVVIVVGTVIFIGALAIALGVGLGVGLRSSNTVSTRLSAPTVTCNSGTQRCGCPVTQPVFQSRIINGYNAVTNSWPWMVYLTMNNIKVCSGFLISTQHVLTAASCVRAYLYNVTVNLGVSQYQSIWNGINITNTSFPSNVVGDIAVVTLGTNISYSSTIRPCCIISDLTSPDLNEHGVIAGWGETSINTLGTVSRFLEQAVVEVTSTTGCSTQITNDTFCAGYDSISACPIDTGGPLMVNRNNAWTCVGIMTSPSGCTNPITFTRVANYYSYILNITGPIP